MNNYIRNIRRGLSHELRNEESATSHCSARGKGKTSLAESILFLTGAIDRQGRTSDGNTFRLQRPRGNPAPNQHLRFHTLYAEYRKTKINILDSRVISTSRARSRRLCVSLTRASSSSPRRTAPASARESLEVPYERREAPCHIYFQDR